LLRSYNRIQIWARKHKYWLLLALSLGLSIFLRVPYFQHDFIFVDEAWWANGANALHRGGQLYVDVALDKNPPIFWFCALLFRLFGINMNSIHAGALLLVCITSVLLFMLGARFFSPGVGAGAALIHAVASTTYYIPRIIGMNTETLMVVFSTAAAYNYLLGVLHRRSCNIFIAGLLASFAFLTKPVTITEMAFLAIFVIFAGSGSIQERLRPSIILLAGFALGVGAFLAYLWRAGILWAWWEQAILYGLRYVGRISAEAFLVKSLRANLGFALIFTWLIILIWLSRRMRWQNTLAYWFTVYWLLSAFVGVAVGRRYYANYFIQIMPPLSLLGAIGLVQVWRMRHQAGTRLVRTVCCAAFLVSFSWFHARTLVSWCSLAFPNMPPRQIWNMEDENRRNQNIAERLRRGTSSDDSIFIWGSSPQLYFIAGRPMATKWMDFNVTDDYPPRAAEPMIQAQTADLLRRSRPRYIVDVQRIARLEKFADFRSLVEQHYSLESEVAGIRMFRLRQEKP
jgi:4-amino-4-deoxy-L-arabinose transferase-like glycosyltransferase